MWLREAFFRWLLPAAFLLPIWLLVGWGVFNAGGWAFLWVLFIAIPSVFFGQLILTLLVRSRPSVRDTRAVSWWDVVGFALWHVLTIAVGCYPQNWFPLLLAAAILVAVLLFWSTLRQLWSESKASTTGIRFTTVAGAGAPQPERSRSHSEVFIIEETPPSER